MENIARKIERSNLSENFFTHRDKGGAVKFEDAKKLMACETKEAQVAQLCEYLGIAPGVDFDPADDSEHGDQHNLEFILNWTLAEARRMVPVLGAGATVHFYSDSVAGTVIEISKSGKTVKIRADKAVLLNGTDSGEADALKFSPGGFCGHTSGTQRYEYTQDPQGTVYTFSLRRECRWVLKGEKTSFSRNNTRASMNIRKKHYDYNF